MEKNINNLISTLNDINKNIIENNINLNDLEILLLMIYNEFVVHNNENKIIKNYINIILYNFINIKENNRIEQQENKILNYLIHPEIFNYE